MQQDNQVDALKAFKKAVVVDRDHADANRNIGFIAIRFRDYVNAEKAFDTALWQALRALDPARPVFVESESKKVGSLQLPDALVQRMREHGECLRVQMGDAARTQLLLDEYGFFARDVEGFCKLLGALTDLRGRERVQHWQAMARAGHWAELFALLMAEHYDPLYERSMKRHFASLAGAPVVELADGGPAALARAARALAEQA
jgi:tRNA 2-selenouridine synthase